MSGSDFLQAGPNFWQGMTLLGGNMANAVDARTPQGFLAHPSPASALNLALSGGMMQNGALEQQQAQTQDLLSQIRQRQSLLPSMQMQGMGAGMKAMLEAQQMQMQLPFMQRKMQMQQDLMSDPRFTQSMFGGGDASSTSAPVGSQNALIVPPEKRQGLVQQAVAGTPVPPEVLDGLIQTESGYNAHATNPKTGAFGLGQILPSTARSPGFGMQGVDAPSTLSDPLENAKFSAQYLYARGKQLGVTDQDWKNYQTDPNAAGRVQAVLGAFHGPVDANGVGPQQYAQSVFNHVKAGPSWQPVGQAPGQVQNPNIPRLPTGFVQPDQAIQQAQSYAQRARMEQLLGMDAAPDTTAAQQLRGYGLDTFKNAAAPQTLRGEFSAVTNPVTGQVIQIPGRVPIYDQRTGAESTVFENPLGGGRGPGVPDYAPEGSVSVVPGKPGPGQEMLIKQSAEDVGGKESRDQYEGALNTKFSLTQVQNAFNTLNQSGWSNTGPGADAKLELSRGWNSFAQTVGLPKDFQIDPGTIGQAELAQKTSKLMAMHVLTSQFGGSREAASTIQSTMKAVPNIENSPQGLKLLVGTYMESANMAIDRHRFETQWAMEHGGSAVGADIMFSQLRPPEAYAKRATSQVTPIPVQKPADTQSLLPGTIFLTPDGRRKLIPGNPDFNFAPQQQAMPPSVGQQ